MKKVFIFTFFLLICSVALSADEGVKRVTYAYGTSSLFMGIMAALWASRTGRSALVWFFFGWILAPFACLFAWLGNNDDLKKSKSA